jgi:hypothetical protein
MADCAVEFLFACITGEERERSELQRLVFSFELRPRGSCRVVQATSGNERHLV